MILAWLVWLFVAPHVYWLDRVASETFVDPVVDLDLAVAFVFALFARSSWLPGLLLGAALGRSLLGDGSVALHFLALGLPIAALIPLRAVFFRGSWWWQGAAAAFLAFAVPRVGQFLERVSGTTAGVVAPTWTGVGLAIVVVPTLAWLLRRAPPLRMFTEEVAG